MRPNCFLFWLLWSLYPPSCAAQRKGNSGPLSISWNLRWMFKEIFSSFFLSFQKQKENKEARGSMFGGIRSRANWSKRQTKCSSAVVESSISGICKIRRKFPYSHFFLSLLYLTPFGREVRGVPFIDGISWNFFFPFSCKKKTAITRFLSDGQQQRHSLLWLQQSRWFTERQEYGKRGLGKKRSRPRVNKSFCTTPRNTSIAFSISFWTLLCGWLCCCTLELWPATFMENIAKGTDTTKKKGEKGGKRISQGWSAMTRSSLGGIRQRSHCRFTSSLSSSQSVHSLH